MGIVFGVIGVERPAFEVLETFQEYDVRHFTQEMVKAEVRLTLRVFPRAFISIDCAPQCSSVLWRCCAILATLHPSPSFALFLILSILPFLKKISSSDFGGKKEFDKRGFGVLAKYIGVFGNPNNEGKTAIAMTAPVVTKGSNRDGRQ